MDPTTRYILEQAFAEDDAGGAISSAGKRDHPRPWSARQRLNMAWSAWACEHAGHLLGPEPPLLLAWKSHSGAGGWSKNVIRPSTERRARSSLLRVEKC
jgi:hypothetical protein